jgi:hypothetical protein
MAVTPFSPTMKEAFDYATKHNGGIFYRSPGGYWSISSERQAYPWWGTPTIEGLVKRGAATYTEWREGRNGKFPVEVRMLKLEEN